MGNSIRLSFAGFLFFLVLAWFSNIYPQSVYVGTFDTGTGTGDVAVTGVGFQPQVVIMTMQENGNGADGKMMALGVMGDDGNEWSIDGSQDNGVGNADTGGDLNTANVLVLRLDNGNLDGVASFSSMDSDGFTVNISNAFGATRWVGFIALRNLVDYAIGTTTTGGATGDKSVTGLGFQPDSYILAMDNSANTSLTISLGFSDGTNQGSVGYTANHNSSSHKGAERIETDEVLNYQEWGGTVVQANHKSMDVGGFTITWTTTAPNSADVIGYLALQGGDFYVGATNIPGSTGNWSTTGAGFQAEGALCFITAMSSDGGQNENHLWVGMADATREYGNGMTNEVDETGNADTDHFRNEASWMIVYNYTRAAQEAAAFVSFDSDGMTNNCSNAGAAKVVYMLFKPSAGARRIFITEEYNKNAFISRFH
jgi:hypothetical protein